MMLRFLVRFAFALVVAIAGVAAQTTSTAFPVTIRIEAGRPIGELKPIWRFFGCDEPNYATMKDGRALLEELGALRPKAV